MANSEQIRNRIIELVKRNEFEISDLLQIFSQLVHESTLNNNDIIKIIKYLFDDILQAKTRTGYAKSRGKHYNSHPFSKGERFKLCGKEFITDNL
jgi:transposase